MKYDFVGHMETFQEDVESLVAVMERHLGGTRNVSAHRGVFDLGKKVHRTNSDEKMREMYTEVLCGFNESGEYSTVLVLWVVSCELWIVGCSL